MMFSVVVLVALATIPSAMPAHRKMVHVKGRPAAPLAELQLDDSVQEKELFNLMEKQVFNNEELGKLVPNKIIPDEAPARQQPMPHHERNWARKMSVKQWQEQQARLNPHGQESAKRVMHNRNTINDNRHDRKAMKLSRHIH